MITTLLSPLNLKGNLKMVAFFFALFCVLFSFKYTYELGRKHKEQEMILAFQRQVEKFRDEREKSIKEIDLLHEKNERAIREDAKKYGDDPIGDVLRNQLKRMREDSEICPTSCED